MHCVLSKAQQSEFVLFQLLCEEEYPDPRSMLNIIVRQDSIKHCTLLVKFTLAPCMMSKLAICISLTT